MPGHGCQTWVFNNRGKERYVEGVMGIAIQVAHNGPMHKYNEPRILHDERQIFCDSLKAHPATFVYVNYYN